jgi:hypothetical protein
LTSAARRSSTRTGYWSCRIVDDEHPSFLFFEMRAVPGCDPGDASVEYYSLTAGRKATLQRDQVLEAVEDGRLRVRVVDEEVHDYTRGGDPEPMTAEDRRRSEEPPGLVEGDVKLDEEADALPCVNCGELTCMRFSKDYKKHTSISERVMQGSAACCTTCASRSLEKLRRGRGNVP